MNVPTEIVLHDREFAAFQELIFKRAGIRMTSVKKALVASRLSGRLRHHGLGSYAEYYQLLQSRTDEMVIAVDMLTTNETYFFREPKHFEFLIAKVLPQFRSGRQFRVWSAACSSGEEPYTLAMILSEELRGGNWEIFGSDISTRMLEKSAAGLYPLERGKGIPQEYLKKYCWKGRNEQAGMFLVDDSLRQRMRFAQINLNEALPNVGSFDVVFLRNVLIYFSPETKAQVIERLMGRMVRGGLLFVGHSESLAGLVPSLETVVPSVYRKP